MSSKDTKHKNRFKVLFIIALVAIVALLVMVYTLDSKLIAYQESETIPASTYSELKSDFTSLQEIIEADDVWMIDKKPKQALERYKNLQTSNKDLRRKVDRRIKRVQNIMKSENDDELTKINLRTELSNTVEARDSLSNRLDSLQQSIKFSFNEFESRNDSLENELNSKTRQLNRKETLKVISFKSDKNIRIHYIGETENNIATGSGVGVWANASIYRGEWEENKPHGKGVFEWADGAKYEGDFVKGERTGEGTFHYPTGEKYVGEFKNGLRSGAGTLYDIDGNISFEGEWEKDKPIQ
ncbi:MORN repeat-containing protein [Psychroflexus salinarum]|uniref:MORN repeat-containing protein n=1 Tax=Psychroflexus salinarum TaxID=546024 RepID=A0ABW3GPC7_9FLAO